MSLSTPNMEVIVLQFRQMLPPDCATAQAIDDNEPWERIAMTAIDDGYIEVAEEFNCLVEACLRSVS
jgi:hypothetical protein